MSLEIQIIWITTFTLQRICFVASMISIVGLIAHQSIQNIFNQVGLVIYDSIQLSSSRSTLNSYFNFTFGVYQICKK